MRRDGFSLIEISVVLVIVATVLSSVLPAITEGTKIKATEVTTKHLEAIQSAIQAHYTTNGILPCPAPINAAVNVAAFGVEDSGANCQSGAAATRYGASGNAVGGGVPTKTLGLPDEYAFDGWGRRIAYHVDFRFTDTATVTTAGSIKVYDDTGTGGVARTTAAVYALISSGRNGHGGFTRGGTAFNSGSTNAHELENCQHGAAPCAGAYDDRFIQKMEQADSTTATDKFDDIVAYRLLGHITAGLGGSLSAIDGTICSYFWPGFATGWRTRTWVAGDCSNGLPLPTDHSVGSAQNGNGTGGDYRCTATAGEHYNHPTEHGATNGTVRCAYFRPGTGGSGGGGGGSSFWEDAGSNNINNTNSGNVGIGTAAPLSPLTVRQIVNGNDTNPFLLQNTGSGVGTATGIFLDPNGNGIVRAASVRSRQSTAGTFANLEFYTANGTNPAEAMRITPAGNVGIGTTNPSMARLQVAGGDIFVEGGGAFRSNMPGTYGSTANVCFSGSGRFDQCVSLKKFKKDIKPLSLGLDEVLKLNPVSFTLKNEGWKDLGFIAEDVVKVDPLLGQYGTDGKLSGVKYDHMTALLAKAIQQLNAKVDDLAGVKPIEPEAVVKAQPKKENGKADAAPSIAMHQLPHWLLVLLGLQSIAIVWLLLRRR